MHNKFKQFGLFVSRSFKDEESTKNNDKFIKCLYQKETDKTQKSHKSREEAPVQKYVEESRHKHKHRKKSTDSIHKKYKSYTSETEVYYIPPEEVKRHRKKKEKSPEAKKQHTKHSTEHLNESSTHKTKKTVEKLLKEPKYKERDINLSKDDYQWLTKKEIFKLISNAKCMTKEDASNSLLLKKFFTFEKQDLDKPEILFEKVSSSKKSRRYRDSISVPVTEKKKSEIIVQQSKDTSPKLSKHQRSRSCSSRNQHFSEMDISLPHRSSKNRKVIKENEHFKFEELKRHEKIKQKPSKRETEKAANQEDFQEELKTHLRKLEKMKNKLSQRETEKVTNYEDFDESHQESRQTDFQNGSRKKHKKSKEVVESSDSSQKRHKKKSKKTKESNESSDSNKHQSDETMKKIDHERPKKKSKKSKESYESSDSTKHHSNETMKKINHERPKKKSKEFNESFDSHNHQSDEAMQKINRVNLERHKFCLVRHTCSIIEIPAQRPINILEKKKKSKSFKKYYKYNYPEEDYETKVETYQTFSDSHKMYQDLSEQSFEEPKKKLKSRNKIPHTPLPIEQELQVETHVSSITVKPKTEKSSKTSQNQDSDKRNKRKSKIPVPTSPNRTGEASKELFPSFKTCQRKIVDAISSPRSNKGKGESKEVSSKEAAPKQKTSISSSRSNKDKDDSKEASKNEDAPKRKNSISSSRSNKDKDESKEASKNEDVPKQKTSIFKASRGIPKSASKAAEDVSTTKPVGVQEKRSSLPTPLRKPRINQRLSEDSKISKPVPKPIQPRTSTQSAPPPYRRKSVNTSAASSQKGDKTPSLKSSSVWSKTSKKSNNNKSNKTSVASKSETKLNQKAFKYTVPKKYKTIERSSMKTSLSNSTFGGSFESSSRATSFFLTKSYKDDDKLTRWQRQKIYSDLVRKKNQKPSAAAPQVLEVRYLTVTNKDTLYMNQGPFEDNDKPEEIIEPVPEISDPKIEDKKDFFEYDLPEPCMALVEKEKFDELFELPIDKALNEILHENYDFLKKDFSSALQANSYSSDDDSSSINEMVPLDKKIDDWYDFRITTDGTISEISCCAKLEEDKKNELNIDSEDRIIDSYSAPGSEESGYATSKSRPISSSFFERPDIKALLKPPPIEIQVENTSSDECGVDIRSIESKSLQTSIECSQKSIQTMSQEEILEQINFSGGEPEPDVISPEELTKTKTDFEEHEETTHEKQPEVIDQLHNNQEAPVEDTPIIATEETPFEDTPIVATEETPFEDTPIVATEEASCDGEPKEESSDKIDNMETEDTKEEQPKAFKRKKRKLSWSTVFTFSKVLQPKAPKRKKRKLSWFTLFTSCVSKKSCQQTSLV